MAVVVGLLAALTSGVVSASAPGSLPLGAAASAVVAQLADPAAASAPSAGLVTDGLRAGHPAAARVGGTDRPTPSHAGGWALAALLLLMAACALAVGVRRATELAHPSVRGSAAGPRAPPALASC